MLLNLIYFIIVLSILIFVHEFGHFLVARMAGVKVLTFSLGFGKKLLTFKRGETEYAISVLPLGGYVKMLGESTEDVVPEGEASRSFANKPPHIRTLIAFAGPFFNVLFAVLIFFVIFTTGYPVPFDEHAGRSGYAGRARLYGRPAAGRYHKADRRERGP